MKTANKKLIVCFTILCYFSLNFVIAQDFNLTEDEDYFVQNLIANLNIVQSPQIYDNFIVFTADKTSRFTGIAFDFENYEIVHSFYRNTYYDIDLKPRDAILFYICKIPDKTREISYRLVIDGVWTTDPTNSNKRYDYEADTYLSYIKITTPEVDKTEKITDATATNANYTRFVYQGKSGQRIRLGGNFTNWDPTIYELKETRNGFYEISIYLPPGIYYYTYFRGATALLDNSNPQKVYTEDGKAVSVIQIN